MGQASHSGRVYRCPDGPSLPPTGGHPFFPPDASAAQVLHPTAEAVLRVPASSTLLPKRNPQSSLAFMSFSRDPDQRGPTMSLLFTLILQSRTRSREWSFLLKADLPCCRLLSSAVQAHSSRSAVGMALIPVPAGKIKKKQRAQKTQPKL